MDVEVSVHYTKELIRVAAARFWIRYMGWSGALTLIVLVVISANYLRVGYDSWIGMSVIVFTAFSLLIFAVGREGMFEVGRCLPHPGGILKT
jgi:hypothetical protein